MSRLTQNERDRFVAAAPGWTVANESIAKTYSLADFNAALGFVVRLGILAEIADHHPDIDIRWNKVTLTLSTHDEDALTEKDTRLAMAIDALEG